MIFMHLDLNCVISPLIECKISYYRLSGLFFGSLYMCFNFTYLLTYMLSRHAGLSATDGHSCWKLSVCHKSQHYWLEYSV